MDERERKNRELADLVDFVDFVDVGFCGGEVQFPVLLHLHMSTGSCNNCAGRAREHMGGSCALRRCSAVIFEGIRRSNTQAAERGDEPCYVERWWDCRLPVVVVDEFGEGDLPHLVRLLADSGDSLAHESNLCGMDRCERESN